MLAKVAKVPLTTMVPVKLLLTAGVRLHPGIKSAHLREQPHNQLTCVGVPRHLVMFVVMYSFDYIDLARL